MIARSAHNTKRSHECEPGTQECVRYVLNSAAIAPKIDVQARGEAESFPLRDFGKPASALRQDCADRRLQA